MQNQKNGLTQPIATSFGHNCFILTTVPMITEHQGIVYSNSVSRLECTKGTPRLLLIDELHRLAQPSSECFPVDIGRRPASGGIVLCLAAPAIQAVGQTLWIFTDKILLVVFVDLVGDNFRKGVDASAAMLYNT